MVQPARILFIVLSLITLINAPAARSQSPSGAVQSFVDHWEARAERVETSEPRWATPLITTTALLDQSLRADFQHSTEAKNATLWNLGASKGLKLIPAPRLEFDVNSAPYLIHSPNHASDGFGDITFQAKYRFFARTREHGNAVLTGFLGSTYHTGAHTNGASDATVSPTLAGGKGFGQFVLESTLGATLPVSGGNVAGRPIAWNTVGMYRGNAHLWLQLESNATYYKGGPKDGQTQEFLTPGVITKFRNQSRRGVTLAAGMQFATSRLHTNDHTLILSGRIHF
jgi:hypothetical protein